MIVNEVDALARLLSEDNLVNKLKARGAAVLDVPSNSTSTEDEPIPNPNVEIEELYKNRTGTKNVPPLIQTLAIEAAAVTSERASAEEFGISHQTVNYYKNGGGKADHQLAKSRIAEVHDNAIDAMLESISLIKPKLKDIKKAVDLSRVASDLGRVISKTTPKEAGATNVKVVVFAPQAKEEKHYIEMEVNG